MSDINGRRIVAEIDREALRHNVRLLRRLAGGVPLMPAVKADAYGHGIDHVVPILRDEGVEAFGVADVAEGVRLRELGVAEPVLVFADPPPELLPTCAEHQLDIALGSEETLRAVISSGVSLRVHVKVDTGMHRLGLSGRQVGEVLASLHDARTAEVVALWTHLATADEADLAFAHEQIDAFDRIVADVGSGLPTHIANSGALVQLPSAVGGRRFVRPGGLVYGLPSSHTLAEKTSTRPVMRLVARVVALREIAAGETVSYGRSWTAQAPVRIATISAGYGDGLPRQLSNNAEASIRDHRFRIAGRVCMDMMMLDLGPPDGPGRQIEVGDDVILFGNGGPTALEAADAAGTIAYDFTTGLTARVPRESQGASTTSDSGAPTAN